MEDKDSVPHTGISVLFELIHLYLRLHPRQQTFRVLRNQLPLWKDSRNQALECKEEGLFDADGVF